MNPRVFAFNYILKSNNGEVLDASEKNQPLPFLEGAGQIIPALEKQVLQMSEGEKKIVSLKADEAYGDQQENLIMDVNATELAHIPNLEVGSYLQLDLKDRVKVVRVTKMTPDKITIDGNHPLAGQDLEFEVELVLIREATQEELTHKHAHGLHGTTSH
ncbi:MAG: peptidylprolyl isomerase [Bdellovibrionales bacterium]|nr:peptidylprolyl isomerase [Bdellovibrionales bacterium]